MDDNKTPLRPDGSIDFGALKPAARRDYLDGWGHSTIRVPATQPRTPSKWFNFGSIEALAAQHRQAASASP